jgi:hypothetical protein
MSPEAAQQAVGSADVAVELFSSGVAVLEFRRPPNNFFDAVK